jgi:hypothetical protein
MIVLDDQLSAPYLKSETKKWYAGSVIVLGSLRPHSIIKDDNIPALLQELKHPTFITINYSDFWRKVEAHRAYCVICFNLPRERAREIPGSLRTILTLPEWSAKRKRMGKVISASGGKVRYYE